MHEIAAQVIIVLRLHLHREDATHKRKRTRLVEKISFFTPENELDLANPTAHETRVRRES